MDISFDVHYRYEKTGRVELSNCKIVKNECYTDDPLKCPCSRIKDYFTMVEFMKGRLMCETRWTPEMLESIGLKEYNVFEIFKKTHGVDVDDFVWFSFDDENITWDDVKVRD